MPRIPFTVDFRSVDWERFEARRSYADQAARRRRELLARRRARLPYAEHLEVALELLHAVGGDRERPAEVRLRSELVRLPGGTGRKRAGVLARTGEPGRGEQLATYHKSDKASRPAAAALARSPAGLPLILLAYYVAHAITEPRSSPENGFDLLDGKPNWSTLMGWGHLERAKRRRHLVGPLNQLAEAGLVGLAKPGDYSRYERFRLLAEPRDRDVLYTVPGEKVGFGLPADFWWYGWHLVLEPGEILTLLMFCEMATYHRAHHEKEGVGASETERWGRYGVSGEIYDHHRTLQALGLLERLPDKVAGRQVGKVDVSKHGKPTEVYRFKVHLSRLRTAGRNALEQMNEAIDSLTALT